MTTARPLFYAALTADFFNASGEPSFTIVKSAMAIGPPLLIFSISDLSRLVASPVVNGRLAL